MLGFEAQYQPIGADRSVESDQLLWMLGSLCQLFRVPFDARLILSTFRRPTVGDLCEAAQALGFRLREQSARGGVYRL